MRFVSRKEDKINIKERNSKRCSSVNRQGRLSIVGIGPGSLNHLSLRVYKTIIESQVIVGYNTYIKLLGNLTVGKEVFVYSMTQEINRANKAIQKAVEGKKVCLVSSGDPGIYGMAGVILELLRREDAKRLKIEIIPGIMAASACASLLGAPLAHDFAVISLSDILNDRKKIEEKLRLAAQADLVMVLCNPKSKSRIKLLEKAWEIIARFRSHQTPVGVVKNAYRNNEEVKITILKQAPLLKNVDMTTTIIVGNSHTYVKGGYMITPRGYDIKMSSPK